MGKKKTDQNSSAAFKVGAISLAFLIIGYQAALFVHRAAKLKIEANRDRPDTVVVYVRDSTVMTERKRESAANPIPRGSVRDPQSPQVRDTERRYAPHSPEVTRIRDAGRKTESFRFNPNTIGLEDLKRLGFSEKQAQSILNYRAKGGRYRRKEDFGRSFVVADSVYERLEPFIDIPLLDINRADSAAFDALPGIGPWFAAKMVEYREKIGGYSSVEQLMDIERFDSGRFDALDGLITCGPASADDVPE